MSDERYCAEASLDGSLEGFLRRVAWLAHARGGVERYELAPQPWTQLMRETKYGSVPGTRFLDEHFELCTTRGWRPVFVGGQDGALGHAMVADEAIPLDYTGVVW